MTSSEDRRRLCQTRVVADGDEHGTSFSILTKEDARSRPEWLEIERLARRLRNHIELTETRALVVEANQPSIASTAVQAAITPFLTECGFQSEARGLFVGYEPRNLRPDFYLPVGGSGILLEVERGKTIDNNMDLLDLWKTHICREADHLFLLVPTEYRSNVQKAPRNLFRAAEARLSTFFQPGNYTNVESVFLFGY